MDPRKQSLILRAAHEMFVQRGYKGTSMDDVAKRAQVGKGTLYEFCDNKADLFYRCVQSDLQAWATQIESFIDPSAPASTILRKMALNGAVYLSEHPLVRDLFSGVHAGLLPRWAERFESLRKEGRASVARVIEQGILRGEFADDLDVETIAAFIQDATHASYTLYSSAWATNVEDAQKRLGLRVAMWTYGLIDG